MVNFHMAVPYSSSSFFLSSAAPNPPCHQKRPPIHTSASVTEPVIRIRAFTLLPELAFPAPEFGIPTLAMSWKVFWRYRWSGGFHQKKSEIRFGKKGVGGNQLRSPLKMWEATSLVGSQPWLWQKIEKHIVNVIKVCLVPLVVKFATGCSWKYPPPNCCRVCHQGTEYFHCYLRPLHNLHHNILRKELRGVSSNQKITFKNFKWQLKKSGDKIHQQKGYFGGGPYV